MTRRVSVWLVVPAAFCLVSVLAMSLSGGCGNAEGPRALRPAGGVSVHLGGYDFGPDSNVLTHPYFTANPTSRTWRFRGWGTNAGESLTRVFTDGGEVEGVKTVCMTSMWLWPNGGWLEYWWLAQDSAGNVHALQRKVQLDPPQLVGVAAGGAPFFIILRAGRLKVGRTWYAETPEGVRYLRWRVTSLTATFRCEGGLLETQFVRDANGDGQFDPSWDGPDQRKDIYNTLVGPGGYYGTREARNPSGGFVRR